MENMPTDKIDTPDFRCNESSSCCHLKLFLRLGENLLIVIVTNHFLNTLSFSQLVFTFIVSQVVTSRCAARDPWRHLILSTRNNYVPSSVSKIKFSLPQAIRG